MIKILSTCMDRINSTSAFSGWDYKCCFSEKSWFGDPPLHANCMPAPQWSQPFIAIEASLLHNLRGFHTARVVQKRELLMQCLQTSGTCWNCLLFTTRKGPGFAISVVLSSFLQPCEISLHQNCVDVSIKKISKYVGGVENFLAKSLKARLSFVRLAVHSEIDCALDTRRGLGHKRTPWILTHCD